MTLTDAQWKHAARVIRRHYALQELPDRRVVKYEILNLHRRRLDSLCDRLHALRVALECGPHGIVFD